MISICGRSSTLHRVAVLSTLIRSIAYKLASDHGVVDEDTGETNEDYILISLEVV